jgi:uncharacterized protein
MTLAAFSPLAFHLLVKPAGAACNLACEYCFYLDKERLYPGSSFRMTEEVLESYLRQYLAFSTRPRGQCSLAGW